MPVTELTGQELVSYDPAPDVPEDLGQFWQATLAEARGYEMRPSFTPVLTYLDAFEIFDVCFPGYGDQPVRAWLHLPANARHRLPVVVQGGRRLRPPGSRRPAARDPAGGSATPPTRTVPAPPTRGS